MVIRGKRTCLSTRGVHLQSVCQLDILLDTSAFRSPVLGPAIRAVFLERLLYLSLSFPKQVCLLIWWIVSETELDKSCNILHYRGQNCSLATRSHTQFHYIYKIPNTCLLLPNYSEMNDENLGNLSLSVPSNPPILPQLSSRTPRVKRKNFCLYPSIDSCVFYFLLELRIVCHLLT